MRRVFVDTNVLKFSATELPRFRPRPTTINWGGKTQRTTVHDSVIVNPNESITDPALKFEAGLLAQVADLGKRGLIEFLINIETLFESWWLPNMDSLSGKFYGAPLRMVEAPIRYGRLTMAGFRDPRKEQFQFLVSLNHKRFHQWQRATGAYQGKPDQRRRQLLDAFHLWCAEHNECEFFLTLDFKLIRILQTAGHESCVQAVKPSELLERLGLNPER